MSFEASVTEYPIAVKLRIAAVIASLFKLSSFEIELTAEIASGTASRPNLY
ncbi:hypothetical protein [Leptospira kmetyi]|uniref:hypothetical protein n=1 Tax=Leptospira kmetyi TaxID=408139 RepID=UPI001FAF2C9A|nr:hypothetical protein [Leptospira kmetyi]